MCVGACVFVWSKNVRLRGEKMFTCKRIVRVAMFVRFAFDSFVALYTSAEPRIYQYSLTPVCRLRYDDRLGEF